MKIKNDFYLQIKKKTNKQQHEDKLRLIVYLAKNLGRSVSASRNLPTNSNSFQPQNRPRRDFGAEESEYESNHRGKQEEKGFTLERQFLMRHLQIPRQGPHRAETLPNLKTNVGPGSGRSGRAGGGDRVGG